MKSIAWLFLFVGGWVCVRLFLACCCEPQTTTMPLCWSSDRNCRPSFLSWRDEYGVSLWGKRSLVQSLLVNNLSCRASPRVGCILSVLRLRGKFLGFRRNFLGASKNGLRDCCRCWDLSRCWKLSATSRSIGRSEEVNFRRLKNGLGSYGCVASTGRCRLGAELPGHRHEGEDTNQRDWGTEMKEPWRWGWRAGT